MAVTVPVPLFLLGKGRVADDSRRHHFCDSARGEVPVFWASTASLEERDPPETLWRRGGTEDMLIMAHQGFIERFCLCASNYFLWEHDGLLGLKGGVSLVGAD